MKRHRIELLITLVLFTGVMTTAWTATRADARVLTSTTSVASVRPGGPVILSGDPDSGAGYTPPPSAKSIRSIGGLGSPLGNWVQWAGRIWVTLLMRYAH
ncbi:MAG: hypothetical protein HY076_09395 [Candidatus Eisenbacteria bacterium]|uniref:Uncharacterized protein n=1 Tax=Eiseniibacteriota bacterium TaxID=2212470 RepID=A0A9D6QN70_UNCEI|nr:hypothetical protein [Candidatus Eisenbacteria bacterium]MBI3540473.1 hypothetical protein [Candidatus Eisenbacteria bacterium]